eukprot:14900076-Heterocapsa_arctica.AAC.1
MVLALAPRECAAGGGRRLASSRLRLSAGGRAGGRWRGGGGRGRWRIPRGHYWRRWLRPPARWVCPLRGGVWAGEGGSSRRPSFS